MAEAALSRASRRGVAGETGVDIAVFGLLAQFRAFYAELVAVRATVEAAEAVATTDEGDAGSRAVSLPLIADRLAQVLQAQEMDARNLGGEYGASLFREAQYVMAALADELCLHDFRWDGRAGWTGHLLERRLFGTYVAGDMMFTRAQALLRRAEPTGVEMALVYFSALALGFQGRYRDQPDRREIATLRQQLYEFVFRHAPNLADEARRISPRAYASTVRGDLPRPLPYVGRWVKLGIGVVVLLLAAGWYLYGDAVAELASALRLLSG